MPTTFTPCDRDGCPDAANRMVISQASTGRTTYTYNVDGMLRREAASTGAITTSVWDSENMPRYIVLPSGGGYVTFTNNGDHRRVKNEPPTTADTRGYVHDGENILSETDGGTTQKSAYTYEPREYGNLVSQLQVTGVVTLWHVFDALGSTDSQLDASEVRQGMYVYEAFGEQKVTGTAVNMFTWVGEQGYVRDTETGEYQLRLRQYQPDKARFKSQDPLGVEPDPNLYRYVGNNPVLSVDPGGTDSNARIDENNPGGADTVKISVTHATNSRLNGPIGTYWRSDGSVGRQIDGKWYVVPYLQVVMAVRRDEVKASSDWDDWFKKHASADAEPPVGNLPGAKPAPGSRPDARNYEPLEPGLTVKLPKLKCEIPLTAAACTRLFTAEERDAWLKDIENIPKEAFDAATDWVPFVNDVKDWINIFRATSIVTGENITKLEKICMAVSVDTATRRAPPAQEDSEVPGKGRLPRQENKGSS